ncbi:MAG TPA: metalloregulator ArsR/SmtB family transcription factor [Sphingobium sp.]
MSRAEAVPLPAPEPARMFAALGDPTRLGLVTRFSDGRARSITQISEGLPISRQAVAKHLDVLLDAGLVRRAKSGREVHFALDPQAVHAARDWLDAVDAQWEQTLDRLKFLVESEP